LAVEISHIRICFLLLNVAISYKNRNVTNALEVPNGAIVDVGNDYFTVKVKDEFINITEIAANGKKVSRTKIIITLNPSIGELVE